MNPNHTQYCIKEENGTTVVLEEDQILEQLNKAAEDAKTKYSEEEICAAYGLMLLHHRASKVPVPVTVPVPVPAPVMPTVFDYDIMERKRLNRTRRRKLRSELILSCKDILKDFYIHNCD